MYSDNAMYGEMSNQQKTQAKLDAQDGVKAAVDIDAMEASQKASEQKGATEKKQQEAEKLAGETIGKTAADILEETAGKLAAGKLEKDVGTIKGAETRGGYEAASFKAGVEGGAGMGAAYDNMAAMVGDGSPEKVAQALKDRTSMTDTKRHLIEDIGTFGLDKFNKVMGTDFHSETAAATALLGGAAVSAEAFQLLRGQKGPIRTVGGKAWDLFKSKNSVPDEAGNSNGNKQSQSSVNQNDSAHDRTSFSDIKNYSEEYAKSKDAFQRESKNLENLQTQRDNLALKGKDTTILDNKIEDASMRVDSHRSEMEIADRNVKAHKYMAGKHIPEVKRPPKLSKIGKVGGGVAAFAAVADLVATGELGTAAEAVWEGAKDTASKAMHGNFTGKDGAAANLSKVLIGEKATKSLANNDFSIAAMQALTNTADGFGQIIDMGASAIVAPFTNKSYAQLRNKDFSITQSGANIVNNAAEWLTTPHGPPGGSGQVPGSSGYVPKHAQTAFSTPRGFNTMSAMGGKSVYGDMTDVKNVGASIHIKQRGFIIYEKIQSRSKL